MRRLSALLLAGAWLLGDAPDSRAQVDVSLVPNGYGGYAYSVVTPYNRFSYGYSGMGYGTPFSVMSLSAQPWYGMSPGYAFSEATYGGLGTTIYNSRYTNGYGPYPYTGYRGGYVGYSLPSYRSFASPNYAYGRYVSPYYSSYRYQVTPIAP